MAITQTDALEETLRVIGPKAGYVTSLAGYSRQHGAHLQKRGIARRIARVLYPFSTVNGIYALVVTSMREVSDAADIVPSSFPLTELRETQRCVVPNR
jgi:hypothetical protein